MHRILIVAFLAIAFSAVAFSQTNSRQIRLSKSELELIALSREFLDSSIGKEIFVVTDGVALTPSGPMGMAVAKDKWESVELEDLNTLIGEERAVVTGRIMFKGHSPEGKAINASSNLKIVYARRGGQWQLSSSCLGDCGSKLSR